MNDDMTRITSRNDVRYAADAAVRMQLPQAPLIEAAAAGVIAVSFFYEPENEFPRALLKVHSRPLIIVVGDDPPRTAPAPIGPEPWVMRRRLRHWMPRYALVHATGGLASQYREIVQAALLFDRLLVVETGTAFANAWREILLPLCPVTVMLPNDGGVHPIPEARH